MGPSLNGKFKEIDGLGNQYIVVCAIIWDPLDPVNLWR